MGAALWYCLVRRIILCSSYYDNRVSKVIHPTVSLSEELPKNFYPMHENQPIFGPNVFI
jgi:hypothetical protein